MQEYLQKQHVDAFIFGHRHWPLIARLEPGKPFTKAAEPSESCVEWNEGQEVYYLNTGDWLQEVYYLNTGDWLRHDSYASFDGSRLCLGGKNIRTEFI